jgi:GT2 family glycosyltransferase
MMSVQGGTSPLWAWLAPLRAFVSTRPRAANALQRIVNRFPRLHDALLEQARGDRARRYAAWISDFDTLGDRDFEAMRDVQASFHDPPIFSILVPVADDDALDRLQVERLLREQVYNRFEVQFVSAALPDEWNAALRSTTAEFVVVADPSFSLRPHALFLLAYELERAPDALLIYGDEDEQDEVGRRVRHYFKPDWNEALLRSQNYLGGLVCLRRSHALDVGGADEELDGDCAWGLFLRATADPPPGSIKHIPFVVTHRRRRTHRGDVAAHAMERRLARLGERAHVAPVGDGSYRTVYDLPTELPKVSVVVPSTCRPEVLRPCVEGVLQRTAYARLELIVVANEIFESERGTRELLDEIRSDSRARVLFSHDRPYNFAKLNNWAAEQTDGALLCFLNDDTEVVNGGWLAALVGQALQNRVGAVGGMLLYPNGRIQHAGCVLGVGGVAAHAYRGRLNGISGYHDRALVDQDVSAVTAACMLVRRVAFTDVGGFDERFAIAYNDIDLCLRLGEAGWRVVWTPTAVLHHKEGSSLDRHYAGETRSQWAHESQLMHGRWSEQLRSDPHYSFNLSLDALHLWEPSFPPRRTYPWRSAPPLSRHTG